jgi:2-oxoisovalerate dehydrogenase E1 component alpha subunit
VKINIMIRHTLKKIANVGLRGIASTPWKAQEDYYNYKFTGKMEFIDHKVRFPVFRAMDLEGNILDSKYEVLDKENANKMLEVMITHREVDKTLISMFKQGKVSFYIATFLEEAIGPAVGHGLKLDDVAVTQYRENGIMLWRGMTGEDIMHSIRGTSKDTSKGKALVHHITNPKIGIFPVSAPIATQIPHAAGLGYAYRTQGEDKIACCFLGEGAASHGDFHAGVNFAATLGSQTLFIVRNNGYAISTPAQDQYASDGIAPRGIGYGMPAIKVDGSDPLAIAYATREARKMVIERKGPVMLETYTYRGSDHAANDVSSSYRTPEVMKKLQPFIDSIGDPVVRLAKYMEKKKWITSHKEAVAKLTETIGKQCSDMSNQVQETSFSDYKTMFDDVYSSESWNLKEQKEELEAHLKRHKDSYNLENFKN